MKKQKFNKKITALLMCILCLFAVSFVLPKALHVSASSWDGSTRVQPETDENGTYLITSGAELAWFADYVNAGNDTASAQLQNTISLNAYNTSYAWVMIGNSEAHPFRGTFDGGGNQIRYLCAGITNEKATVRYGGLFGVVDGGTVENITVTGTVSHDYAGTDYGETYTSVGGICGYLKSGNILNCTNYAAVTMSGESLYRNCGGIAGISEGLIMNCKNYGTIATSVLIAQRHIGGIAGMVTGPSAGITSSVNRGSVQGYYEVGGIAGAVKDGAEISGCCNYGTVDATDYLGGICGKLTGTGTNADGSSKESKIINVYNYYNMENITATIAGGIVGQMGYENWSDQKTPAMPVLENAYSIVTFTDSALTSRGSLVGYFRSGEIGNVYGLDTSGLSAVDVKEGDNARYTGSVLMEPEKTMKTIAFVKLLGSSFVKTGTYDENAGYPKLVWQTRSDTLNEQVREAALEVKGWLTDKNRAYYGSNYVKVESLVSETIGKLDMVTDIDTLTSVMTEARDSFSKIKTGEQEAAELYEAIDDALAEMEDWAENLIASCEYTEEEQAELRKLKESARTAISKAASAGEVDSLLTSGKAEVQAKADEYLAAHKAEELRASAIKNLTEYHSGETFASPYQEEIEAARTAGLEKIRSASTAEEISSVLLQAENAIDDVITSIPSEGAWDGVTTLEPAADENGIYQIGNGAELAWLSAYIASGNQASAVLTADIDLGNKEFSPIGNENNPFMGSFDAQGFTVKNLLITTAKTYAGLFGRVYGGSSQVIENLTVTGKINVTKTAAYAGGIAAYVYGESETSRNAIVNCRSRVTVTMNNVVTDGSAAGGIAGYIKNTWIRDSQVTGTISIPSEGKGGIRYYAGGIVGLAQESSAVRRCCFTGNVSAGYAAGGIVGRADSALFAMTSDYSTGVVSGSVYAGGLAGSLASAGLSAEWCYASGPVNAGTAGKYMGALFGACKDGTYANLYAKKRTDTPDRALVGASEATVIPGAFVSDTELAGDAVLMALNGGGDYFIHDYLGIRSGYPILSWEMSLEDMKTGAKSDLAVAYPEEDYGEQGWQSVLAMLTEAEVKIDAAYSLEEVYEILTDAKTRLNQIETIAQENARILEEAKKAAISELESYGNPVDYETAEQEKLVSYRQSYTKQIQNAKNTEDVAIYLERAKRDIDLLPTKAATEEEKDRLAAQEVDALISDIGEVVYTDYVKNAIETARKAYDSLTENQKALVTKYPVLAASEDAYKQLEENAGKSTDDDAEKETDPVQPSGDNTSGGGTSGDGSASGGSSSGESSGSGTLTPVRTSGSYQKSETVPAVTAPVTDTAAAAAAYEGAIDNAYDSAAQTDFSEDDVGADVIIDAGSENSAYSSADIEGNDSMTGQMEEALLSAKKKAAQIGVLKILGIILGVLTLLALIILIMLFAAAKKRKERQVHY